MKKHYAFLLYLMKISLMQALIACVFVGISWAREVSAQELLDRRISIQMHDAKVKTVLMAIEKAANVKFSYSPQFVDAYRKISFQAQNSTLGEVLNKLLPGLQLTYTITSNQIILRQLPRSPTDETSALLPTPFPETGLPDPIVSGRVTDEKGNGLPGVNVLVKGTQKGTASDGEGNYSLSVPDGRAVLVFSFVGYASQEFAVGDRTTLNVSLVADEKALDEVVVTAFGIKREQKVLGYSSQKVGGEQLSAVGNTNLANSLQGKAAGVQVRLNSGMPGRAAQINIRGARSLTGNNEPLYVIDGLPVSGGGRAIDFNPSDIESIDILKGAAASALYGLRASNGVIVVTTKSGKSSQQKPTVTFETQASHDRASFLPDLQREYAQGNNGIFDQNGLFAFGPKISSLGTYTNLLGEQEQAASYDNLRDFFQSGLTLNNNLEIMQGGGFGNYSVGVGNSRQTGIVPNTGMVRTNFKFNGLLTPFQKFKLGLSVNYSDSRVDDFPDETGNVNFFRGPYETPPSYNLKGKPYAEAANPYQQIFFRAGQNNPYWIIEHNYRTAKTNRTFGNIFAEYQLATGLKAVYRFGVDNFQTNTARYDELGTGPTGRTIPPSAGQLQITNVRQNQINSNLFLTYSKQIGTDLSLDALVGNETYDNRVGTDLSTGVNFVTGGWANLSNATTVTATNSLSRQRVVGFYGNVNVGYKEMLFLNVSGRNDIVSNMLASRRSFFYPSVGLSFILTEAVESLRDKITFAKLRANYAEVGQVGPLFVNDLGYVRSNPGFLFPYNGVTSFLPNGSSINPNLRPENTRSVEVGGEVRFLNNRVGIDYTYFNSLSNGQILGVPLPPSTGAATEVRNAGKMRSSGHEVMLRLTPVKSADLQWDFNINFTKYRTVVEELPAGLSRIVLADANAGQIQTVAEQGQVYPSLFGRTYVRDPQSGKIVVNSIPGQATTGMPLLSGAPSIVGTPNPDFEFNLINTLRFKQLSLNFQVDWRQGGSFFSLLHTETRFRGLATETLDRNEQVVLDAVKGRIVNGGLVVEGQNDLPIYRDNTYWSGSVLFNNIEAQLNDASFVRLRELNLSYDIPAARLKKILGLSGASFFLTSRNLFLITKAFVDPELNMSSLSGTSTANSYGIEWYQTPQTRSIGGGIRLKW